MANFMPGEWDLQKAESERRRRFADQLLNTQQPQGGMVGNVYVPPSWTQQLATVLNKWQGGQMMRDADSEERKVYEAQQQKYKTAAQKLAESLRGTPAVDGNNVDDAAFMNAPGIYQPAKQPSVDEIIQAQLQYASDIGDPQAINQAATMVASNRVRQQERADDRQFRSQEADENRKFREQQAALERQARADALKEQIAAREQAGLESANLRRELAQMQMQTQKEIAAARKSGADPYFQAIQTPNGIMKFNARTGQMEPVMVNGAPVMKSADDPALQGSIAEAKAGGKVRGESQANAQVNLPQDIAQAEQTVGLVDDLLKHPGFDSAVGFSSYNPLNKMAGNPGNDFNIRLDQLKGQQFLQAYQSLRGGGQITEVEGKKATDAISRMNTAASEKEFKAAAKEFQDVIRRGVERARQKAAGRNTPAQPNAVRRYNPATGRIE